MTTRWPHLAWGTAIAPVRRANDIASCLKLLCAFLSSENAWASLSRTELRYDACLLASRLLAGIMFV
eukprot:SAG31_NODE_2807_length_5065_cov_3.438180_3_plen_67_part_00